MTQEDKDLLLQDLCSRLPYGVKVLYKHSVFDIDYISSMYEEIHLDIVDNYTIGISEVKPYLFPMSSMTEEQKKEYNSLRNFVPTYHYEYGDIVEDTELYDNWESIDYLIANHFDFRGLIEKGLAINCTNLNIY